MAVTQEYRLIKIVTPLADDVLLLDSFEGEEAISSLFELRLSLLSEQEDIDLDSLVGEPVIIDIVLHDGSDRYISGYLKSISQGHSREGFIQYWAEMVPWLWFLTCTTDSRIFQNKSVPEIIEQIFTDLGFSDFRMELSGDYPQRVYCVQYRESDFNFVSRLMEEEGIVYFFEHKDDKHVLVVGDHPEVHPTCPGPQSILYHQVRVPEMEDDINEWKQKRELHAGRWALDDFNFETPSTDLGVTTDSVIQVDSNDAYEHYHYPGEYEERDEGDRYVKLRIEAEEAQFQLFTGESNCRVFSPGYRFDLDEHFLEENNQTYVLTRVHHSGGNNYGHDSAPHMTYENQFSCIPYSMPFRPERVTRRPVVKGPQTAMVVGPKGEEIYVDKYGQVKVQFHWDREGKYDEKSSCWMRVSQYWAGKTWGAMHIPRIGQEVIVDFLEGDPDRPIITGRVYNAEAMPPYDLPGEKTKSTLKSDSTKGGGGYNELRFEDKKGQEQIYIHAEKDQDNWVNNDSRERVIRNRHLLIDGKQAEKVSGDKHLQVGGSHNEKVSGSISIQAGVDKDEKVGNKCALDAGMEIHLKAGMKVVVEAGLQLTIKAAGGFIDIGPAGITIQGTLVRINSGGAPGVGSGSNPTEPEEPEEAPDS